ncbi:MAG TPA: SIS domain-containing protein, partial [Thermomicrobiales bacterium]|nr:SIS domain-containing protein [Thermomicrobiales bacterium]
GRVASSVAGSDHVFVIGKGAGAGVAMETALKVKEASYVHAEAFTAGELKHGAIALIEPGSPCIVCGPDNNHHIELGSSSQELRSRGGYTFGIGMPTGGGVSDGLRLPDVGPANAIVQVTIAQHIAYQSALLRNLDPDYPRNLAKSVTVK